MTLEEAHAIIAASEPPAPVVKSARALKQENFAKSTLPRLAELQEQQSALAAAVETMLKRRR